MDELAVELRRRLGLLLPSEAAVVADVDERTLANQRSARTGPPYCRWGRSVYYREAALLKWLEESETEEMQK